MSELSVTLVDCTLRDGGYYNDWDFSTPGIHRYLRSVARAGVPVVEIGFRMPPTGRFLGAMAYSTDEFLDGLRLPEGPTYGVMVNAKDLCAETSSTTVVESLFDAADRSPISLVRIAANFGEVSQLGPAIEALHGLGYDVGLNLMKVSELSIDQLAQFSRFASTFSAEVAYFADSFGCLRPGDIAPIVAAMKSEYDGPIGCHLHDNMSFALANSLAAVDAGVTWVDGTILGMGRGPGNARTEYLALELNRLKLSLVDNLPLLDVVTDDFATLQAKFGWGTSIYYYLAALHRVHPSYIQEITRDGRYSVEQIVGALEQLSVTGGSRFDEELMRGATDRTSLASADGTWDATGWCQDRDVLILGAGPGGIDRRSDVEHFIKSQQPVVIGLNVVPPVAVDLVDRFAICDPIRATIDADLLVGVSQPLCSPRAALEGIGMTSIASDDYGMSIRPGELEVRARGCVIPRLETAGYAIAIAAAGGAARIFLSGFDGFAAHDPRQENMVELFDLCSQSEDVPEIVALTPTNYPVRQGSLYGRN